MEPKLRGGLSYFWLRLVRWRNLCLARIRLSSFWCFAAGQWCALVCGGLILWVGWQTVWGAEAYGIHTAGRSHPIEAIALSTSPAPFSKINASSDPASALAQSRIAQSTMGLEAPVDMEDVGREFLIVGYSDRLLDREIGERVRSFWPLRELMAAFNRDFVAQETPLLFSVEHCPTSGSAILQTQQRIGSHPQSLDSGKATDSDGKQYLTLCYEQLQAMDDYADDLSGSLTEQHLAVLDMVYFLLDRELSRLLVALDRGQGAEPLVNIQSLDIQTLSPWLDPETWESLPEIAALDQLTAVLPQRLQLQQQTGVLSGAQWLFNQGNPLLEPDQLKHWTKDAFSPEVYQRLICTASDANPTKFPFLKQELPAKFPSERC